MAKDSAAPLADGADFIPISGTGEGGGPGSPRLRKKRTGALVSYNFYVTMTGAWQVDSDVDFIVRVFFKKDDASPANQAIMASGYPDLPMPFQIGVLAFTLEQSVGKAQTTWTFPNGSVTTSDFQTFTYTLMIQSGDLPLCWLVCVNKRSGYDPGKGPRYTSFHMFRRPFVSP